MRWISLSLALGLGAACSPTTEQTTPPEHASASTPAEAGLDSPTAHPPGNLETIEDQELRLECLVFHTTVHFKALPDIAQKLEATYQGAERAQWRFVRSNGQQEDRMLRYRSGNRIFALEPGSDSSVESQGAEHSRILAQLELRRAMYLWPDGFDWQETAGGKEVTLPDGTTLLAHIEADRPTTFSSTSPELGELERFEVQSWREFHSRIFAASATLVVGGQEVWTESLSEVTPDCEYASFFFVPPDRRELAGAETGDLGIARHLDLPARLERRLPLAAGGDWKATRAEGARQRELFGEAFPAIAERLEVAYELDEQAAPRALLLRIDEQSSQLLPAVEVGNWSRQEAGPALSVLLPGSASLTAGRIQALGSHIPAGGHPGSSHVRFPTGAEATVQLVLRIQSP